jgi:hypothetical protein
LSFGGSAGVQAFVEHILGALQQTMLLASAKRVRNPNGLFANLRDDLRLRYADLACGAFWSAK